MDINLHIHELVLEGFPAEARALIGQAVEAELTQLMARQGVPQGLMSDGAVPRLDGGSFTVSAGARPEVAGRQIAHAIYRGLSR